MIAFSVAAAALIAACIGDENDPSGSDPNFIPDTTVDAGAPSQDDASNDQSAPPPEVDSAPPYPPICTVPVAFAGKYGDRSIYLTQLDFHEPCPISPLAQQTGYEAMTIGFLAGSPGYSINARSDYELFDAKNGSLDPQGRAIDALEGDVIEFSLRKRPDAGVPIGLDAAAFDIDGGDAATHSSWHFVIRMNPDADPAKWTVTVYQYAAS